MRRHHAGASSVSGTGQQRRVGRAAAVCDEACAGWSTSSVHRLTCFLILRGVERGDIGLRAELHAGRLARPLDDHAIIAVQLFQKPS